MQSIPILSLGAPKVEVEKAEGRKGRTSTIRLHSSARKFLGRSAVFRKAIPASAVAALALLLLGALAAALPGLGHEPTRGGQACARGREVCGRVLGTDPSKIEEGKSVAGRAGGVGACLREDVHGAIHSMVLSEP